MTSCNKCDGKCCKYVTVIIPEPKDQEDWDELKWYLMHDNIQVYKDTEDEWIVEFSTHCKHLKENKCEIYENRPIVCRDHNLDECDANEGDYAKVLFKTPEDIDKYRSNATS